MHVIAPFIKLDRPHEANKHKQKKSKSKQTQQRMSLLKEGSGQSTI